MKLRITTIALCVLSAMTIMMSHSGGRATQFSEGNTGAPGDDNKTCGTCHVGGDFGTAIEIQLTDADGMSIDEYIAGETYTVTAVIATTSTPAGYGLQMVGLDNDTESSVGELANPSANAQLANANDRVYLEQAGLSSSETFSVEWTAPAAGTGAVTFYATGHAANGNSSSSGDESQSVSQEFGENVVESIVDFDSDLFSISPNPVLDLTTISFNKVIAGNLSIMNSNGQLVLSQAVNANEVMINLMEYSAGSYYVTITGRENEVLSSKKLIKL